MSDDPKWPLILAKTNRLLVLNVIQQHTKYDNCAKLPFLRYRIYKVYTVWPLLTPNDLWPPPKTIGFFYSMWHTYIPNMRSVQASWLEISCLQGFHNLTPVDPKWPLTSTKNNRLLVLNVAQLHTKYEICPSFPAWDIVLTRFSQFDPCWSQMTFDLQKNRLLVLNVAHLHTKYEICPSFPAWDIVLTRFSQFDPCWPQMTFDLQNNRLLVLNVAHLHTKYEICPSFPAWDIVLTRFSQFDPCWSQMTFDLQNNRLLVLNVAHLHTKYDICPSFPAWDIVFTRFSQFNTCWPQMTFDLHQKQ